MAWEVKYRAEFTDILGKDWRVDIEEEDYAGAITEMQCSGDPLNIEYLTYSDDLFTDPIKGSTATLSIECTTNFQYIDLYSSENMVYKMKVYYGSTPTLYWQGWVSSDYTEPYDTPPYTISVTAADGLGLLKYIDFTDDGDTYSGREIESTIILNILGKIGYTEFNEFVNLYEDRIDSDTTDSVFDQIKLEQLVFKGEDCYTALVEILKHYNAIIRQKDGIFTIYRPYEFTGDTVYGRNVTSASTTDITLTPDQYLYRSSYTDTNFHDYNGGILMYNAPASKVMSTQNYNQADSIIKGYDFNLNDYNTSTFTFKDWTRYNYFNYYPISYYTETGWSDEKDGAIIQYGGITGPYTTIYIYQQFGDNIIPTSDIFEFSFDYRFLNNSTSNINTRIYIKIKDVAGNIWLKNKVNSETELDESTSSAYIMAEEITATPGLTEWNTWRRIKVGLTKPGPYIISIHPYNNNDLQLGIKNIVFRATSNIITGYKYAVTGRFLWWKYTGSTKQYETEDVTEIIQREYIKENSINGDVLKRQYELGDVSDSDIDDIMDQFNGALSINVPDTFTTSASRFVGQYLADYKAGGVDLTNDGGEIFFTSDTPGINFTGSTSISNVSGGLTGSATTIQINLSPHTQIDQIVLSGSSGTGRIIVLGASEVVTWDTSLTITAENFVTDFYDTFYAAGYILSSVTNTIYIEKIDYGTFSTTFNNLSGTLGGTVSTYREYSAGQARIDRVALSGTYGTANITCDGVTKLCTYSSSPTEQYTESWSTRSGSESSNLLELLTDEQAAIMSKGRHFIQLNLYEFDADTIFQVVSNLQDPLNTVSGGNARLFIPNRGSYNIRDRVWTMDIIEIGDKEVPV